jgi:integrase
VRGVVSLVPRKTAHGGKGKRVSIPIHPALAAVLAETPPRGRRGFVMPDIAAQYEASSANFSKAVQAVFHKCGIETAAKGGGGRGRVEVGFHSLRHTFVSLSANAGTPLAVVQAIVGHSNPAMTRHYYHESDEALQKAVAALPDVTRPALPETAPERTGEAVGGNGERFEAFRAIVDAMTDEELNQARAYIKNRKGK